MQGGAPQGFVALAGALSPHALIEEARGIVRQHPDDGRGEATPAKAAKQPSSSTRPIPWFCQSGRT